MNNIEPILFLNNSNKIVVVMVVVTIVTYTGHSKVAAGSLRL